MAVPNTSKRQKRSDRIATLLALAAPSVAGVVVGLLVNLATDATRTGLALAMLTGAVLLDVLLRFRASTLTTVIALVVAVVVVLVTVPAIDRSPGGPDLPVLLSSSFEAGDGWTEGSTESGSVERTDKGLVIRPRPGFATWELAPVTKPVGAAVTIEATARVERGSGGWGVWCRATPDGERYEFIVSHTGSVEIKGPGISSQIVPNQVSAAEDNRMLAECSDPPGANTVQLSLTLNGRQILVKQPAAEPLGPGPVGLHGFAYGGQKGDAAVIRFSKYVVYAGVA